MSTIDIAFQELLIFKAAFDAAKKRYLGILPSDNAMRVAFQDHFVYFRPRDSMGGDFYKLHHNGETILVVADCSGHSVEGALMAMVASGEVETIVETRNITEPKDIIKYLHRSMVTKWGQQKLGVSLEVSIITLSEDHRHMRFCGAMRPMYLVREGHLQEFEKSNMSVGDMAYEAQVGKLVQHDIELEKGDTIYMSSDGYESQTGVDEKPLGKRRFRELIEEASRLPMTDQGRFLDDELNRWKGTQPQLDDICIVAVTT